MNNQMSQLNSSGSSNNNTTNGSHNLTVIVAVVSALLFLARPADAWSCVPNKTLRLKNSQTATSATSLLQWHPRKHNTHTSRSTGIGIPPTSSLHATIEDNKSEEDQSGPAPRRTRRIDDILEETGDTGRTISVLESSLKLEQEKSSTLAVRLAYAEQVIDEQKKRLEAKRSSLQKKSQALSETQKKLKDLEQRLNRNGQPMSQRQEQQQQQGIQQPSPSPNAQETPWQQPPLTSKERQYPLITNWSINSNSGEVTGTVSCHPSIPDGTTIVTSGLNMESFAIAGEDFVYESDRPATVVTTRSGSMYQLGVKKVRRGPPPQTTQQQQQASFQQQQQAERLRAQMSPNIHLDFPLTGQSISNGRGTKYLLAGEPKRKPSGRSEIIMAYKCDDQLRVCDSVTPYVVKLSTHKDKLRREYENYRLVQEQTSDKKNGAGGWIGGALSMFDQQSSNSNGADDDPFVTCYDFLPACEGSIVYAQHSALVLEKGHEDLRDYEFNLQQLAVSNYNDPEYPASNMPVVMDPSIVQSSLLLAAKCIDVLHSRARLVWTDLKAENLIFMQAQGDLEDPSTISTIKGVDLESAIPHRGHPLDYTPEACPPEFAKFHLGGNAYDFVLEYSYDVWSFGMLAYELTTGSAYFRGKSPIEIMAILGDPDFVPPLTDTSAGDDGTGALFDPQLRELIRSCLKIDPRQRISVKNILRHPYFTQTTTTATMANNNSQQQPSPFETTGGGFGSGSGTFW